MARRKVARMYVVPHNGVEYLVEGYSYRDVAKHVVGQLIDEVATATRIASAKETAALMLKGVIPIDLTTEGPRRIAALGARAVASAG